MIPEEYKESDYFSVTVFLAWWFDLSVSFIGIRHDFNLLSRLEFFLYFAILGNP